MDKIIPKRPTVLIAGGSRGIGAATARRFARGGWNVAINYHHSRRQAEALAEELAAGGVHVRALSGDVSQQTEVQALVRQTQEQLGGLNALVCCAGVAPRQMLLTDLTAREWREVMEVNLDGVFHLMQAAVPWFVHQHQGAIVTLSSMWGVTGGSCEAAYSASKGAVNAFTQAMAKELAPSGVAVNAVACGAIDTEMNACFTTEEREAIAEEIPAGRFGLPAEAAELVWALAAQSPYLTGQIIRLDGGWI